MTESGSAVSRHYEHHRHKKNIWTEDELTCQPLDTYTEILNFLQDPPSWRTLCKELTPHSRFKLRNMDLNIHHNEPTLETPDSFCHFNPDAEDAERHDENNLPKTLVCHDMANGYHDDRYIDGTGEHEAYTFYNWAGIDIFCYFSHHLITIPPLGWINVGHAHGVQVIGTVITEWAEGIVFWDKILDSETEYQNFASALVAIAKTLKFDGWLLNVENKISKPEVLLNFVKHLHRILHEELPHAVLIWYDSVTVQGTLNWQNGLNDKNKAFFDACDGLFTNYSWYDYDVRKSAIVAGDRRHDLYIGIDVWGRNFYGGGLFNTQEAVKVPYECGCSMAIFAPAWTHEAIAADKSDVNAINHTEQLSKMQQFVLRDRAFWGSIWPFLNTRLPCNMPFATSFCRGNGKKRRHLGEVISPLPWFNLRHQQYQPNSAHGPHGYMLSTTDNVVSLERQGVFKNTKGILRYRESFLTTRQELLSSTSRLWLHHSQQALVSTTRQRTLKDIHEEEVGLADEPRSVKRKMKNAILQLFQIKSARKVNAAADVGQAQARPNLAEPDSSRPSDAHSVTIAESDPSRPSEAYSATIAASDPSRPSDTHTTVTIVEPDPSLSTNEREATVAEPGPRRSSETYGDDESLVEPGPSRSSDPMRGRSMQQMSVVVELGHGTEDRTRYTLAAVPEERECLEMYRYDSFGGGSCLRINPSDGVCDEHRVIRLFHGDWPVESGLVACVVTKRSSGFAQQALNVKLSMVTETGADLKVVLVGRPTPDATPADTTPAGGVVSAFPLEPGTEPFRALQRHLLLNEPAFYVPVENSFDWIVRYYEVSAPGARITSVNLQTELAQGPVLLGHFGLCSRGTVAMPQLHERIREISESGMFHQAEEVK